VATRSTLIAVCDLLASPLTSSPLPSLIVSFKPYSLLSMMSILISILITYIDDLVATGGTLIAACDLLASVGATIVECACMVELKFLGGLAKLQEKHAGVKVRVSVSIKIRIGLMDSDMVRTGIRVDDTFRYRVSDVVV
jgi:hypothetical protein